jgi:hypothetical protein
MKKNTKQSKQETQVAAEAIAVPQQTQKAPDFYGRLIANASPTSAALILAALCRRKDYHIRRCLADHEHGISFDDAVKGLAEVFQSRKQEGK